jgi:amino acid transporter
MLGVSGFESSANFVEEQERGVFPKTLKNMWIIVSVINPLMAFFALSLFNLETLQSDAYQNTLLIEMGEHVGGYWVGVIIAIDAVLVLSGAVLTSYVGVSGLLERMTLDRILPPYFLKRNKKGSSYRIIIMFFLLSVSVLLITKGNVKLLAGVYTISFLSVMALFGIGNILLKIKRTKLPRPEQASWVAVFLAIIAVIIALSGNIIMPPKIDAETGKELPSNIAVFMPYFLITIGFIMIMLNRIVILRSILKLVKSFSSSIIQTINDIVKQEFVFFTKGDNISNLNRVMLYIKENEHTKKIKIVHVHKKEENDSPVLKKLRKDIEFLDREYPDIKIDFVELNGTFGPELIQELSKKWNIPVNFMFIGSLSNKFPYRIEELGGVRLII